MTAHNNAEMVKAKADNMDLVVLSQRPEGDWFELADQGEIHIKQKGEYFLCLPKHKEACLHWLKGGVSQLEYTKASYPTWNAIDNDAKEWSFGHVFMNELLNIRIKPRKEIRHTVIHNGRLVGELFKFDSDIRASFGAEYHELQIFQIEVEV